MPDHQDWCFGSLPHEQYPEYGLHPTIAPVLIVLLVLHTSQLNAAGPVSSIVHRTSGEGKGAGERLGGLAERKAWVAGNH